MSLACDLAADVVELEPCLPSSGDAPPLREFMFRANAWLPDELAELRRRFAADETFDAIATVLGRPTGGVSTRAWELGLRRTTRRPWTELEDAFLVERYAGEPAAALAAALGRGCPAVYARAHLLGLGDCNPPRWTEWEDAQVRAGYARGVPVGQIATLVGRPFGGVVGRADMLGIRHLNKPDDWSDAETSRALVLAAEGHRYLAIVELLVAEGFPRREKGALNQKLRKLGYGRGWGRLWTPEEDEWLRRAYAIGASLTPLKTRLGRTACSIRWRVKELGLQGKHALTAGWRTQPAWSAADEALLRAEFGKTPSVELAAKLGRSKAAMFSRANSLRLVHGYIRLFTAEEQRAIGIAWRRGWPLSHIATALGRDAAVISKQAIRLGIPFDSPDRPIPPQRRYRRPVDVPPVLADILASEPVDQVFDARLSSAAAANAEHARRNRSTGASNKRGTVLRGGL